MASTSFPLGSEWRKWDLHVHTPLSIIENYGGDTDDTWENFISDLEALPSEFKVLGINDYLFIDGYEKVLTYKSKGRLKNIELILPILEFRLNDFAGVNFGAFKRPNLHVIFSNEISPSIIRSQFLATLDSKYKLEKDGANFQRTIDRDSLAALGTSIINSVPENQRSKFKSPIIEGFNNLNLSLSQIQESLVKDCFSEKYLLAIGKTEWEELKWSDASIASKKHLINSCQIVFTSAESVDAFHKGQAKLREQKVRDLLLDCSDAHNYSENRNKKNANVKDRIGKCFTWIKADPTFDGLKQILYEPENRVFIGDRPPVLLRTEANTTKYIESLRIRSINNYGGENGIWFRDIDIKLNPELIAIIGNKGNGKSAISDIIGLVGNTHKNGGSENPNFSFLRKGKFLKRGFAEFFEADLTWKDGTITTKKLDENTDTTQIEKVRYLPQNYFESITNELESIVFKGTIKDVIFSHIPEAQRFGKSTFVDLESYKTQTINTAIQKTKLRLTTISNQIVELEKKSHPKYLKNIESRLKEKQKEQREHIRLKPKTVRRPKKSEGDLSVKTRELAELNRQIAKIDKNIKAQQEIEKRLQQEIEDLRQFADALLQISVQVGDFIAENSVRLKKYGIPISKVISLKTNDSLIRQLVQKKASELSDAQILIGDERRLAVIEHSSPDFAKIVSKNLIRKRKSIQEKIDKIKNDLSKPIRAYQTYTEKLKEWKQKLTEINGDDMTPDSLKYFESEIDFIQNELRENLVALRKDRLAESLKIYRKKKEIIDLYTSFKESIDLEIQKDKEFSEKFRMQIDVGFKIEADFKNDFLGFVNKNVAGSFRGTVEGEKLLNRILEDKNFLDESNLVIFLEKIIEHLELDQRDEPKNAEQVRNISDQIPKTIQFYQFLFDLDYLTPIYELKLDGKDISQLSPGEKGALLLVFYLMIDQEEIPLIIDQPEDNLDNQSVYKVLTHFIRSAKKRRQIIIVTHNPNLAVGADAEQVIFTQIDKQNQNTFTLSSGGIENIEINKKIVDILEGTMPAFDKRKLKYKISEST